VTFVPTRTKVGRILFGYLGSDPETDTNISEIPTKLSLPSTRRDPLYSEYMVPMSMVDAEGNLLYIFRRDHDESYTEILTADGSATVVTEVIVKQQEHHSKTSKSKERKTDRLTVNFVEYVSSTNRILMLGMAVIMFNQLTARHTESTRSCCCACIIC